MTELELLTGIYNVANDIRLLLILLVAWLVIKLVYKLFNSFF